MDKDSIIYKSDLLAKMILNNLLVPSVMSRCMRHINVVSENIGEIYLSLIDQTFKDMPKLQTEFKHLIRNKIEDIDSDMELLTSKIMQLNNGCVAIQKIDQDAVLKLKNYIDDFYKVHQSYVQSKEVLSQSPLFKVFSNVQKRSDLFRSPQHNNNTIIDMTNVRTSMCHECTNGNVDLRCVEKGFNLHDFVFHKEIFDYFNNDQPIVTIAIKLYYYWKKTSKHMLIVFMQLMQRLYIIEPLKEFKLQMIDMIKVESDNLLSLTGLPDDVAMRKKYLLEVVEVLNETVETILASEVINNI